MGEPRLWRAAKDLDFERATQIRDLIEDIKK